MRIELTQQSNVLNIVSLWKEIWSQTKDLQINSDLLPEQFQLLKYNKKPKVLSIPTLKIDN